MDKDNQDLFEKLSLTDLPQVRKDQILAQLDELVQSRVALALSEKMTEEQSTELDNMVDNGTPDQFLEKIKQYVPDYDQMVAKIAEDTISELANNKDAVLAEVERLQAQDSTS